MYCGKQSLNNLRVACCGVFCAKNPAAEGFAESVKPCGATGFGVFFILAYNPFRERLK